MGKNKLLYIAIFSMACSQYVSAQNEDKPDHFLDQCYYTYGGGKIVESHCTTEPLAAGSTEEKRYPLAYNAAPGAATKTANPKSISLEVAHWKLAGQQHCHVLNTVGNRQALLGFLESETSLRATNLTVGEGSIRLNAQGEKCDMIFLNFKPN